MCYNGGKGELRLGGLADGVVAGSRPHQEDEHERPCRFRTPWLRDAAYADHGGRAAVWGGTLHPAPVAAPGLPPLALRAGPADRVALTPGRPPGARSGARPRRQSRTATSSP